MPQLYVTELDPLVSAVDTPGDLARAAVSAHEVCLMTTAVVSGKTSATPFGLLSTTLSAALHSSPVMHLTDCEGAGPETRVYTHRGFEEYHRVQTRRGYRWAAV